MTKNSHIQFDCSNSESQVLDSIDPLLITSELPDLKNWFSSYEYQSPELNTADGLDGSTSLIENNSEEEDVSFVEDSYRVKDEDLGIFVEGNFSENNFCSEEETCVEDSFKAKDENLGVPKDLEHCVGLKRHECNKAETCVEDSIKWEGENLGVGELDSTVYVGFGGYREDDCDKEDTYVEDSFKQKDEKSEVVGELGNDKNFVHNKVYSEGFVGCRNATENDYTNQVADMSDTLNFSSEALDIKNWFSSYVYRSPALDTGDEFNLSSFKESKDVRGALDIETTIRSKEEKGMETTFILNSDDLIGRNFSSAEFVGADNFEEDYSHDHQNWANVEASRKRNSYVTKNLPLGEISQRILQSNSAPGRKDVECLDINESDSTDDSKRRFPQNDSHKPIELLRSPVKEKSSPRKSLKRKEFVQKDCKGKAQADNDTIVSPTTNLDFIASRSSSRSVVSNDKENSKKDYAESGFISARKNRSLGEHDENSLLRPSGAQSQSLRNGVKVSSIVDKAKNLTRVVLADTTNTRSSDDVLGVTGKWKCPQKSKPNRGPPMKQLRLERWVHRL